MVANDIARRQMRTIAHGMAVGHNHDIIRVRDGRSDGRIDTEIGRPSGNQDPLRIDGLQHGLQVGALKWIVQRLANDGICGLAAQLRKELPTGRIRLEVVS